MDIELRKEFVKYQKRTDRWIDRINAKPSYPWLSTVTGSFLAIPGLRGFWPMSAFDSNGAAIDLTGLHNLANVGQAEYSWPSTPPYLAPYCYFDNTTSDYLWVADNADHDILGTEAYVLSTKQGLTLGGWFQFGALTPANNKGVIGKWNGTTNNMSYLVYIPSATSTAVFLVSTTGAAVAAKATSTLTLSVNTWYFIVARYYPSTEVSITVNGTQNEDTSAVGVPANLFNCAADFNIMAHQNGAATTRNYGRASFCFLSAMYLGDDIINHLYEMSRGMFGV